MHCLLDFEQVIKSNRVSILMRILTLKCEA